MWLYVSICVRTQQNPGSDRLYRLEGIKGDGDRLLPFGGRDVEHAGVGPGKSAYECSLF